MPLVLVLQTTPCVKLLGVRHRVSPQVDHVSMFSCYSLL